MATHTKLRRRLRNGRLRRSAAVALFAMAFASPAAAADEAVTVWQWTDNGGVTRYTPDYDRIPSSARHTAVAMQPGAVPSTAPVYFEPNPHEPVVSVPTQEAQSSLGSAAPSDPPAPPEDIDSRIRAIEAQIADDEEALKKMISTPGGAADVEVSAELREIAARLPQLQSQLALLRQRRGGSGGP